MEKYPKTLLEFERQFSDEKACKQYLYKIRWPEGIICPRCSGRKAWENQRGYYQCSACGYQISVTADTIFQRSRTQLTLWFRAIWWVTSQKSGASALGLKRILGLASYETAWTWLHKLRRAMIRPGRERLTGQVEVDETYLGGLEEGLKGRGIKDKTLIIVAAQINGQGIGRIRMKQIPDASAEYVNPFIRASIEPGSTIITDGWSGYYGLKRMGYHHKTYYWKKRRKSQANLLPRVHRVISLLKRWLMGTHQGAVRQEHLNYYLDEFTFRFNRRTSRHRGMLFFRLIENAVLTKPCSYEKIVRNVSHTKRRKHNR